MAITVVPVYDATHDGISHLPPGQVAGYSTGSGGVPWTAADWRAHPGAVRICQDPGATDVTADVLDVESGAATPGVTARWAEAAAASFATGRRPGQRTPAVYCNRSNMTAVVNALVAAKITGGVSLWLADWNLSKVQATMLVTGGSGPWPVIGVQYSDQGGGGAYDLSVFSTAWLGNVSGGGVPPVHPVLSQGAAGPEVVTLQKALNRHGARLVADGIFGPATETAVKAFQKAQHLTADGVVGPLTWAKLSL